MSTKIGSNSNPISALFTGKESKNTDAPQHQPATGYSPTDSVTNSSNATNSIKNLLSGRTSKREGSSATSGPSGSSSITDKIKNALTEGCEDYNAGVEGKNGIF